MKAVYAVVLSPAEQGLVVSVPDLDINTEGRDIPDAIDMARDAICLWGICEEDAHRAIPAPSSIAPSHKAGEIVTLVDVDFDAYRRASETRAVRKNVTIPSWLNELAEKNGVNFSALLQESLKTYLKVQDR